MVGLHKGGNEPPGSLKALIVKEIKVTTAFERLLDHLWKKEMLQRLLRDIGRYPRVAAMKECITDDRRLFRLAFAEENINLDWNKMCGTLPLHLRAIGCLLQLLNDG
ncbi:hypothetical protein ANN_17414 [Periplaneta americana]|uniref:Uncharacterized protein n=1 Tax=Periplaneta americana TaxID=6978 RepID=A0ABQ8SSW0_PERAM|nr:hypothetical protein ANN_17414 [Periplaneta americana]